MVICRTNLTLKILIWAVAVMAISLFPPLSINLAEYFADDGGVGYPIVGHPYITFVEISTSGGWQSGTHAYAKVSALYASPRAKRAIQALINARITHEDSWPAWWHERRKFPMVSGSISFFYLFHPVNIASAEIYKIPDGYFMLLSKRYGERGYYVHGRSAAVYGRLFKPLFSSGPSHGLHHRLRISF
jgi:hypothetical protein